jgi:hypothetical protein
MKTQYFSKVENKYVFNFTLIFWHLFIIIASLAIIFGIGSFLWSVIPPTQKKVEKKEYPLKAAYPQVISISLDELLADNIQKDITDAQPRVITKSTPGYSSDTVALSFLLAAQERLKSLIPPQKYSWGGQGHWYYPMGKMMWDYYKLERYREWISTEMGLSERINSVLNEASANTNSQKADFLNRYCAIIEHFPEEKRKDILESLLNYVSSTFSQNISVLTSLTKLVQEMDSVEGYRYVYTLARFGIRNEHNGPLLINYITTIVPKFEPNQCNEIIDVLIDSYDGFFSEDLVKQIESTDLYLQLLPKLKLQEQATLLVKFYRLYTAKNYDRLTKIKEIDASYDEEIDKIDQEFELNKAMAQEVFYKKKEKKQDLLVKSLIGIAGGVALIVVVAFFLVFFSIQRSVRKIESKLKYPTDLVED